MDSDYMTTSEPGAGPDKTIGRYNNNKQDAAAYHQRPGRGGSNDSERLGWSLDRLEAPEEVGLFEQFEELSKLYALEPPFVARSQVELVFDVFDGRKLRQSGLMEEEEVGEEDGGGRGDDIEPIENGVFDRRTAKSSGHHPTSHSKSPSRRHNFTWSRLLSFKHNNRMGSPMRCCMSRSDTSNEMAAAYSLSASSSGALQATSGAWLNRQANDLGRGGGDDDDGSPESRELREEAQRIIGPILSQLRRRSSLLAQLTNGEQQFSPTGGLEQQQQVILEGGAGGCGGQWHQESVQVSVCLFDKRGRLARLKWEAENGRRRAQAEACLAELIRCATGSGGSKAEAQRLERRVIRGRQWAPIGAYTEAERLSGAQLTQLVDLTKNSLNHLIDAQLLLRNKLTSEQEQLQNQQQSGQQQSRIGISMEYDALLRNNFNLLKVWQNLEETKRLVCFVCEPIKSNLGDLFWFSRQRQFARDGISASKLASPGDPLLVSPLVSFDGIQVKRGLLQILEALNYLHSICKLIHRNLTPRNILVVANGNWKLSGLEFAIRFESATISQSASIMAQEGGGSLLLRCSASGAAGRANFCRQRTLHQTKCDEFVRRPKAGSRIVQPEVDYLAPEIWRSAKCSHKSDMFSYGLILGQTYDLWRHKPPISCRATTGQNYDSELKKLNERRKRKLGRLVPFEMRSALLEMLDTEPNVRPSANHALQLFKRPIELCKVNEDTLRHLRSSLGYLETRLINNNGNINNVNTAHKKRINYFAKVTSAMADQPARRACQTRSLHLLNLLLRGVDSLASPNNVGLTAELADQQQQQQPQLIFHQLRQQFELTFESLRHLYDDPRAGLAPVSAPDSFVCAADSRSLMLVIALHRRLLEQVAQMRNELPPVSRLAGPSAQTNRLARSHRSLAEMEDRLHCLVSRHSVAKLAPVLTDPTLKLEEFLLVFELVNDLLAFLGQKCRQNFTQRGKQLLNDLTPVTGCPSLSSSDEDYEDEDSAQGDSCQARPLMNSRNLVGAGSRQTLGSRETLNNFCISNNNNTNSSIKSRMSHRFSEYDDSTAAAARQVGQSRHFQFQNQSNLPCTKISITAPSPMGSMRDINSGNGRGANETANHHDHRQQHQIQARMQQQQQQQQQESEMIERTSQLSMSCAISYSGPDGELVEATVAGDDHGGGSGSGSANDPSDAPDVREKEGSKTRSQLIDELLKTINDDSFNDLVDFNNKFAGSQQQQQQQQQQLTPSQLANLNRPKSAIDSSQQQQQQGAGGRSQGPPSTAAASASGGGGHYGQQPPPGNSSRPNSLALANNQQQTKVGGSSPSTFDNVIRRMSTNIVQNFNKMSNTNSNNNSSNEAQQQQQQESSYPTALRREKSSNASNSLYVDNQVPVRRHSDNTINVPRIQVALSSPQASKTGLGNQRASVSASKLANKWKLSTATNRRESNDKLSPNLSGALGYMRRHSSGNTTGNDQSQSNGQTSNLLFSTSPFKTKSSSNLGIDFLISNRSMKRRCSAASMLGHQTQRKAEDLIDAGMKSVQNMFG